MTASIESILKQLTLIKEKINTKDSQILRVQINLLERIISRFFEESSYAEFLDDADESNEEIIEAGREIKGHTYKYVKSLLYTIIENMTIELNEFGFPSKDDYKVDKSINIHNNHTITQSQFVDIVLFKQTLQDSLTGKQYKELMEIAKAEKNAEKAIPKLLDKLKSFGSDVASNIVANLITNPHLYTVLF